MSMRRARKKLNETAKEEIRKMDRERYQQNLGRKKEVKLKRLTNILLENSAK